MKNFRFERFDRGRNSYVFVHWWGVSLISHLYKVVKHATRRVSPLARGVGRGARCRVARPCGVLMRRMLVRRGVEPSREPSRRIPSEPYRAESEPTPSQRSGAPEPRSAGSRRECCALTRSQLLLPRSGHHPAAAQKAATPRPMCIRDVAFDKGPEAVGQSHFCAL